MASPAVTLDQLIGLNDELLALARGGMPLEPGLAAAGRELSGRVGAIARQLAERLERGEPLESALASEGIELPAHYRAIVLAGIKSGQLTSALEGLARVSRSAADLRRAIGLAMLYPFLVAALGLGLAALLGFWVTPRLEHAVMAMGFPLSPIWRGLIAWGPIWVPAGAFVLIGAWIAWGWSGGGSAQAMRRIPGFRGVVEASCAARFAEMLALLLEHDTPYGQALALAGDSSGDPSLAKAARAIAGRGDAGMTPAEAARTAEHLPPLLRWVMSAAIPIQSLIPALNHLAQSYRARARSRSETVRLVLPILVLVAVGGGTALLFTATLLIPYVNLLLNILGGA